MALVNLTPHPVNIIGPDDQVVRTIQPTAPAARLAQTEIAADHHEGTKVYYVEYGHLLVPPPEVDGTYYIVSLPTALAVDRPDFLVPYSEVRDADGRILGVRALARPV